MNDDDRVKSQIHVWKTCVEVQEHFNEIGWKIRGLALTVLTAALGAGAVAIKDGTTVRLLGFRPSLASLIFAAALIVWLAFYFVDRLWYHVLLIGAVRQGEALERAIVATVAGFWGAPENTPADPEKPDQDPNEIVGLASVISAWSPTAFKIQIRGERRGPDWRMHARTKLTFLLPYCGRHTLNLGLHQSGRCSNPSTKVPAVEHHNNH